MLSVKNVWVFFVSAAAVVVVVVVYCSCIKLVLYHLYMRLRHRRHNMQRTVLATHWCSIVDGHALKLPLNFP